MRYLILLLLFALPVQADTIVAMCDDFPSLQASGALAEGTDLRAKLDAVSGAYFYVSADGSKAMVVVSSTEGLESVAAHPCATMASYETIFGYRVQRVVDGEPVTTTQTINVPESTIYHDNWVETGETDEMGMPVYENQPTTEVIPASSYEQQVPVYDEVPRVPGLLELYQSIYPYNVPDEDGNTRSQFVVTFGADSVKDIVEVP